MSNDTEDPLNRTRKIITFGFILILVCLAISNFTCHKEAKVKTLTDDEIVDLYEQISYKPSPAPQIKVGESEYQRKLSMSVIEANREVISREIERQKEIVEAPIPTSDILQYAMLRCEEEFGLDHWNSLFRLVERESGWNLYAVNQSSGACGLAQAYPCMKLGCDLSDMECQVNWLFQYIKGRYGDPTQAIIFHGNNGWY